MIWCLQTHCCCCCCCTMMLSNIPTEQSAHIEILHVNERNEGITVLIRTTLSGQSNFTFRLFHLTAEEPSPSCTEPRMISFSCNGRVCPCHRFTVNTRALFNSFLRWSTSFSFLFFFSSIFLHQFHRGVLSFQFPPTPFIQRYDTQGANRFNFPLHYLLHNFPFIYIISWKRILVWHSLRKSLQNFSPPTS